VTLRKTVRRHAWRAVWLAAVISAISPAIASAQVWIGSTAPRLGSVEVSGGAIWSAGLTMGSKAAQETRNVGTGTGAFDLFSTDTKVTPVAGGQARIGIYLAHSVSLETGLQYQRPRISTRVTGDAEQAPDITSSVSITRYVVDGSLVVHLTGASFAGGRGVPFISGGGGYIREVYAGNQLIETGTEYHGGVGLKLWFGQRPPRFGLRLDAGAASRTGGADFNTARRTVPTAGASVLYLF
jgi:hypothetical protein